MVSRGTPPPSSAQSTNQPLTQSTNQHTNQSTNQRTNPPTHQPTNTPTHQHTNAPTHQHTNAPIHQSTNPPTHQHTNSPTHRYTNYHPPIRRLDAPSKNDTTLSGKVVKGGDDPLCRPLSEFREKIEYCCLLLESEVTESALRTLSIEILSDKGPLPVRHYTTPNHHTTAPPHHHTTTPPNDHAKQPPHDHTRPPHDPTTTPPPHHHTTPHHQVGEIGKLLQEITANSSLSTILKDKFGGLKKFLEWFADDFMVSSDHPFNPHVYLKAQVGQSKQLPS